MEEKDNTGFASQDTAQKNSLTQRVTESINENTIYN